MALARENAQAATLGKPIAAERWVKNVVVRSPLSCVWPVRCGYDVLRGLVAVVLLTAAGLKTHQLATEPVIGTGLLESRWFLMVTVEFELFFGLWLLTNILPKPTWAAALVCFGLFTCVSLYKALSGNATCDCFGRVPVNPWYTATLDLAIVLSLLRWHPAGLPSLFGRGAGGAGVWLPSPVFKRRAAREGPSSAESRTLKPEASFTARKEGAADCATSGTRLLRRASYVLLLWLCVGLPAAYAMASYSEATLSDVGEIIGNGELVVLEPERWVGRPFPLIEFTDIGDTLKHGDWMVMLYHHDCANCGHAIEALLRDALREDEQVRVAFIELPPYGVTNQRSALLEKGATLGRLSDKREWFVATPLVLALRSSVVNALNHGHSLSVAGAD